MPEPAILVIPEGSLVVLVGVSGSGKSSFTARHFRRTQVLSSDAFRAILADDEADQSVSADAFRLLHYAARLRLGTGRTTVVDATSVRLDSRADLLAIARACGAPAAAIVLAVDPAVAVARDASRPGRSVGADVIAAQFEALCDSIGGIGDEGFDRVWVLDEAAARTCRVEIGPHPPARDERA